MTICRLVPSDIPGTLPNIVAGGLEIAKREPLAAEIDSFLESISGKTLPVVTGADGRRALKLAIDVLDSIKAHAIRADIGINFN